MRDRGCRPSQKLRQNKPGDSTLSAILVAFPMMLPALVSLAASLPGNLSRKSINDFSIIESDPRYNRFLDPPFFNNVSVSPCRVAIYIRIFSPMHSMPPLSTLLSNGRRVVATIATVLLAHTALAQSPAAKPETGLLVRHSSGAAADTTTAANVWLHVEIGRAHV